MADLPHSPNDDDARQRSQSPQTSTSESLPRRCTNPPAATFSMPKFRLVPTSFENANAVIVVSPSTPNTPEPKPLLFVGPAVDRLRRPHRPLAKGTRLHPYRIARSRLDQSPPSGPSNANTPQAV